MFLKQAFLVDIATPGFNLCDLFDEGRHSGFSFCNCGIAPWAHIFACVESTKRASALVAAAITLLASSILILCYWRNRLAWLEANMAKSENKTKPEVASVAAFVETVADDRQREDVRLISSMMARLSDVDVGVLETMCQASLDEMDKKYPKGN